MESISYANRDRENEAEIKQGISKVNINGNHYYAFDLSQVPEEYRKYLRNDFKAASIVLNSLDSINVPSATFDSCQNYEVFLTQDKGIGKTKNLTSFYDAAAFLLLVSKNDIKGNIVEGSEGYAPIDFEAFLRSPLTAKVAYLKYGGRIDTDVELKDYAIAEIQDEFERHKINFEVDKLASSIMRVTSALNDVNRKLRSQGYYNRAENLERNLESADEKKIL